MSPKEFMLSQNNRNLWANSAPEAVAKAVFAQPLISPWHLLLQQSCLHRQRPEAIAPMVFAAMVLSVCRRDSCTNLIDGRPSQMSGRRFLCVSMASGTRCSGVTLNMKDLSMRQFLISDGHAEVLARRSFLAFLLDAMRSTNRDGCCFECAASQQFLIRDSENRGWQLRSDVQVHLVVTHWPCGSMALSATFRTGGHLLLRTPSAKLFGVSGEDSAKETNFGATCPNVSSKRSTVCVHHHILAAHESVWERDPRYTHCTRVKPGKGNPNLSMSCSDKLWRWSVFGLQGNRCMRVLTRPIRLNSIEVAIEMSTNKENSDYHLCGREQAKKALDSLLWKTRTFEEQVGEGVSGERPVLSLLPLPSISVFPIDKLHASGDNIPKDKKGGCNLNTAIGDSRYSHCSWMTNVCFCKKVQNTPEKLLPPMEMDSEIHYWNDFNRIVCSLGNKRARASDHVIDNGNNLKIRSTYPLCAVEATWKESLSLTLNTKAGLPQGANIGQLKHALENATASIFMRYPLSPAWVEAQVKAAQGGFSEDVGDAGPGVLECLHRRGDAFQRLFNNISNSSSSSERKLLWVMKNDDSKNTSKHA